MRKINHQWYSPTCVSLVFASGTILGKLLEFFSNDLLHDIIFIGAAVLAFHFSNLFTDYIKVTYKK
jgi:hypothetical protein